MQRTIIPLITGILWSIASVADIAEKPNILFLLVDDLGWADVGYQGEKNIKTPNTERLANDGMIFTDAYAAAPVCSPTRASIITGKYPARLKLTSHIPSLGKDWEHGRPNGDAEFATESGVKTRNWLPLNEVSLATVLKEQGYRTGFFGKWHLGHEPYHPVKHGFDVQKGSSNFGQPPSYYAPYTRKWKGSGTIAIDDLGKDAREGEYLTDRLTAEACRFISANKDNRFFCYLSYYTVHDPYQPRRDLREKHGEYEGMIAAFDESIGKIRAQLKADGIDNNTVIVFMSDNGGCFNNPPLRSKKGSTYEGGIREPMIVCWPGIVKPGSTCSVPVITTDFFPTFLDIAGGNPKASTAVDGLSLVPLLKGGQSLSRDAIYWHFPHRAPIGLSGAIRKGNYKLIENFKTHSLELYDLSTDIGEANDLANAMPEKVKEMHAELKAWRKSVDANMMPWDL